MLTIKWKREDTTPEILRELLDYDPEAGTLIWRERDQKWIPNTAARGCWNTRFANTPALNYMTKDGYRRGSILGHDFFQHTVIWALHYGQLPNGDIDHKDRDPTNNKISNLRQATRSQNLGNCTIRVDNTSGYRGVSYCRRDRVWTAKISVMGRTRRIGSYQIAEAAAEAYDKAALQLHGEFANVNFPEAA